MQLVSNSQFEQMYVLKLKWDNTYDVIIYQRCYNHVDIGETELVWSVESIMYVTLEYVYKDLSLKYIWYRLYLKWTVASLKIYLV